MRLNRALRKYRSLTIALLFGLSFNIYIVDIYFIYYQHSSKLLSLKLTMVTNFAHNSNFEVDKALWRDLINTFKGQK